MDDEIQEMYQEDRSEKEEGQFSVLSLCTFRGLRWQLISIIVMMMGQQLSGVNGVSGESQGGTNTGWDFGVGGAMGTVLARERNLGVPLHPGQYQIHG